MIKKIAAILVTYNGEWDKETIFKVATINEIEQMQDLMQRARKIDKMQGIVSAYRIQIFQ